MYISSFNISGYRSLRNVQIPKMLPVCIFHGLNNSGKSNILSAIEMIFRRKTLVEDTTFSEVQRDAEVTKVEQVTKKLERVGRFWQGRINEFKDNFYLNGKADITFSVTVSFTDENLRSLATVLTRLHNSLAPGGHKKALTLCGRIKYVDDNSAEMLMERAVFNKRYVVFDVDETGKKSFFPKVAALSVEERLVHFDNLMGMLADAFALLPSNRYLMSEQLAQESEERLLPAPKTFKTWLFNLSLNRAGHKAFEEIKTMFASRPFSVGDIGFSKEGREIEIMVKEKNVRLPISRLGSGHQQILYIIANLVLNKKKMMGIEELELNLSPTAQKMVFEKLKRHIYEGSDLVSQIIITSHSDYFEGRTDVRRYGVEHDGQQTIVKPLTATRRKSFFPPPGKKLPL